MPSLFEIDQEILSCIDLDSGEILDAQRLDALQIERNLKIEGVACWVKNLQADAVALKAEKEAFAEREKAANRKVEQLKRWLANACGGEKFLSTRCAVSFRRSEVVAVEDVDRLPADMLRLKYTCEPDKVKIKEALKAGQQLNGCSLVESINTTVK